MAALPETLDEAVLVSSICRESFVDFVKEFWSEVPGAGKLTWNWHMDVLCDELQDLAERVFRIEPKQHDTVVNISPGTSKSTIASILFHPWTWTRMPSARHLNASHTETLVLDLASKARDVIRGEKYQACFPEVQLVNVQDTKGYYRNTLGGDRLSCTVAGKSPMGFHAHFLGVDDPIDPKKAVSEAELRNAKDFMNNVLPTRKVNKSVSVTFVIMQRLHREDPTAVMLERSKREDAGSVRHICLPAELADNVSPAELRRFYTDMNKDAGVLPEGVMDPVRLSKDVLKEFKATLGAYGYSGQFGQNPVPLGGGMFKDTYFTQLKPAAPYHATRIRYWDRACLVAGTTVSTRRGQIPIESVVIGDEVMTRLGWKHVSWCGITKYVTNTVSVTFVNGSVVTGTADHPVWTNNRGWVELSSLIATDEVCSWGSEARSQTRTAKSFCSAAYLSSDALASGTTRRGGTMLPARSGGLTRCTGQSGEPATVTFPLAIKFTTRTRTGTTTRSRILSVCPEKTMPPSTLTNYDGRPSKSQRRTLVCRSGSQTTGASRNTRNSAVSVDCEHGSWQSSENTHVNCAVNGSRLGHTGHRKHARKLAETSIASRARELRNSVSNATKYSSQAIRETNAVLCDAQHSFDGSVPVYDLTVEDAHEFYANGILVHNSTQDGGCYTAGVLMARDDVGNYFVEHVVHGQWEPDERNERMLATAQADRRRYGPNNDPLIYVEAEGGSSGRDAWKGVARVLAGFPVMEDKVTGDKDRRAEPWSCQLAAKNVYIVDDGTWDVKSYIDEHCLFRPEAGKRGKYKDQVDASSGAFNLLSGQRPAGSLRVYSGSRKPGLLRIVCCERANLAQVLIDEHKALFLSVQDPLADGSLPEHGLGNLLDTLVLQFADLDPAECQESWGELVAGYGKPAEDLVMTPQHARKFWNWYQRERAERHEVLVICQEDGKRVAKSLAYSIADSLGLSLAEVVYDIANPDEPPADEAPNKHVYECLKTGRY